MILDSEVHQLTLLHNHASIIMVIMIIILINYSLTLVITIVVVAMTAVMFTTLRNEWCDVRIMANRLHYRNLHVCVSAVMSVWTVTPA